MKIIDLLNKIANGEEVPIIVKYNGFIYKYDKIICDYDGDDIYLFDNTDKLNDEVEILEEEKKIPGKLNIELSSDDENKVNCYRATNLECDLAFKINSIIDYLKSKGE